MSPSMEGNWASELALPEYMRISRARMTLPLCICEGGIKGKYFHHVFTKPSFIFEARGITLIDYDNIINCMGIIVDVYYYKENKIKFGQELPIQRHYCDYQFSEEDVDQLFKDYNSTIARLPDNDCLRTMVGMDKKCGDNWANMGWYSLDDCLDND